MHYSGIDRLYAGFDDSLGLILTFHHVSDAPVARFAPNAHLTIRSETLEAVIDLLGQRGIEIISLENAHARINARKSEKRFAVLTFDDGYLDNFEIAYPVLRKHDVPFAVYVTTGLIEGTADLWWRGLEQLVRQQDRLIVQMESGAAEFDCKTRSAKLATYTSLMNHIMLDVPEEHSRQWVRELCWLYKIDLDAQREGAMMSWDHIKQLAQDNLCTIGGHTVSHPVLSRLSAERAIAEINNGAAVLESATGERPQHFCFPYGSRYAASSREFQIAEETGFKTAVTTRPGFIYGAHADHLTSLPRISVNGLYQSKQHLAPLLSGLPTRLANKWRKLNVD